MDTVLMVSERPEQASALAERLGLLGMETIPSSREWKLAVRALVAHPISLILLDVDASAESLSFFDMMRELSDVPIMVRGSMSDTEQVICYLERGACDYTSKATSPAVLVAKMQSLIRSAQASMRSVSLVVAGDVSIDLANRSVFNGTNEVSLTPLEFRLLGVLAENVGRACKREDLLKRVWGDDFTSCSHYLRLYIGYLRQKLEADPKRPQLLLNEWGYGYRLVQPRQGKQAGLGRAALRLVSPG